MEKPVAIVDALIPAYNAETTIRSAIASIQRQTLPDLHIIVVDDGSTDATPRILAEMAADDPRITVHRQANGGIVAALNNGLALGHAPFVARHDADDLAYPERLETQVAYLRAHPDAVAVGARMRHIDGHDRPLGTVAEPASPEEADPFHIPSREPYIIHPILTVRRSAIEQVGGYRHAVHSEDTDLYWRLAELGRLVNLQATLGDYRLHDASISGGSIVNGRIMAVSSQLSALSARRRRAGTADFTFPESRRAEYKAAGSLAAIVAIAEQELDEAERRYLHDAVAAKLLELTTYRPYELETSDCAFIGAVARRGYAHLPEVTQGVQRRHVSGAAARLASHGAWNAALRLVPRRQLPGFLARVAMRIAVPPSLQRYLRSKEARAALGK